MKWIMNKRSSIYDLAGNKLRICIHELYGLGHMLFLTCHALQMEDIDLHTEEFEEAVRVSKDLIKRRLDAITKEAESFVNDNSDIELSLY